MMQCADAIRHFSGADLENIENVMQAKKIFQMFLEMLEHGKIRAAELVDGEWVVNSWVKEGILLGFRLGTLTDMSNGRFSFFDKNTYPLQVFGAERRLRIVPGGTSIRRGSYCAEGVVIMPPSYVNVGAYVDEGTMLDSHSLVGSCAQIGKRCHISAGTQIGGVLEPINALPVIVEDDVFIGGNCGLYEGIRVGRRAVLAAGNVITGSSILYDIPNARTIEPHNGRLTIPEGAVVVPGSRPARGAFAAEMQLQLAASVIVKYRDERTSSKTALEEALR